MTTTLCTLFNHYYLDKALVLVDSLKEVSKDFKLYILCMDDRCHEILNEMAIPEVIPVKLSDFEDGTMLEAKANRTFGEYCWTCSSSFILYILENYKEPICTYIDADMYFYKDPEILVDEMRQAGKTVMITPHRFSPENMSYLPNGIYCVEFNTFVNEPDSLKVLRKWKNDCLECCTSVNDGIHFGDQKYLDTWPEDYPETVHVCQHPGAGVAPWNMGWYEGRNINENKVYYRKDNRETPIVFYHFQHITYLTRHSANICIREGLKTIDYNLVNDLYLDYLIKIEEKKKMLESVYGIDYIMTSHPAVYPHKATSIKELLLRLKIVRLIHKIIYPFKYRKEYIINI